jgi:hypothetical protein
VKIGITVSGEYRKKHWMYRAQNSSGFQASTGGLETYSSQIKGKYYNQNIPRTIDCHWQFILIKTTFGGCTWLVQREVGGYSVVGSQCSPEYGKSQKEQGMNWGETHERRSCHLGK